MNLLIALTNKNLLIIICIILLCFSLIFFGLIYFHLNNITEKIELIDKNNIKNIFLSNQQFQKSKEYIYLGNSVVFNNINNPNKRLRLEALMQTAGNNGFELKELKENEAVITKNAANELKLKTGDYLTGDLSYSNTASEYKISAVLDPFFGTFNNPLSDSGLIIIGYDVNFESNMNVKYIIFSEAEINELDQNTLYSINDINSILSIKEFKSRLVLLSIFYHGLFLFLALILFIIVKKIFGKFWQDYLIFLSSLGHYRAEIVLSFSFLSFLIIFIPLIAGFLFMFFYNYNLIINLKECLYILLLCGLLTIIWILMGLNKFNIQARF